MAQPSLAVLIELAYRPALVRVRVLVLVIVLLAATGWEWHPCPSASAEDVVQGALLRITLACLAALRVEVSLPG